MRLPFMPPLLAKDNEFEASDGTSGLRRRLATPRPACADHARSLGLMEECSVLGLIISAMISAIARTVLDDSNPSRT